MRTHKIKTFTPSETVKELVEAYQREFSDSHHPTILTVPTLSDWEAWNNAARPFGLKLAHSSECRLFKLSSNILPTTEHILVGYVDQKDMENPQTL